LVYSVTSRSSYDEIESFRDQIIRTKDLDDVPFVICGNKCDLEHEREVTTSEAKDLGKLWGVPTIEASAFTRTNVDEAFFQLVREIRKQQFKYKVSDKDKKKQKKIVKCSLL